MKTASTLHVDFLNCLYQSMQQQGSGQFPLLSKNAPATSEALLLCSCYIRLKNHGLPGIREIKDIEKFPTYALIESNLRLNPSNYLGFPEELFLPTGGCVSLSSGPYHIADGVNFGDQSPESPATTHCTLPRGLRALRFRFRCAKCHFRRVRKSCL